MGYVEPRAATCGVAATLTQTVTNLPLLADQGVGDVFVR